MKIAVRAPHTSRDPGPVQAPLALDDRGCAEAVMAAPDSDSAWLALIIGRDNPEAEQLAARLTATMSRQQDATAAVAVELATVRGLRAVLDKALGHMAALEQEPPASWTARLGVVRQSHADGVERLAALVAAELEALFRLDDAAHAAAAVPAWVEVPADQRPIPATEASWARVSRLIARELQSIKGLTDDSAVWDALGSIDPHKELGEGDVLAHEAAAKDAVRDVIRRVYGGGTT